MGLALSSSADAADDYDLQPKKLVFPEPDRRPIHTGGTPAAKPPPLTPLPCLLTPSATMTAMKDEKHRRSALDVIRGDAVKTAVARGLARAAADSDDLEHLKSLQREMQTIAAETTRSLEQAAAELSEVHGRQLERARRRDAMGKQKTPATRTVVHADPPAPAPMPAGTSAPVPLSRPRSTPDSVRHGHELNSPESVRAYLAERKAQLAEQRAAAAGTRRADHEPRKPEPRSRDSDASDHDSSDRGSARESGGEGRGGAADSSSIGTPEWVTPSEDAVGGGGGGAASKPAEADGSPDSVVVLGLLRQVRAHTDADPNFTTREPGPAGRLPRGTDPDDLRTRS